MSLNEIPISVFTDRVSMEYAMPSHTCAASGCLTAKTEASSGQRTYGPRIFAIRLLTRNGFQEPLGNVTLVHMTGTIQGTAVLMVIWSDSHFFSQLWLPGRVCSHLHTPPDITPLNCCHGDLLCMYLPSSFLWILLQSSP